MQSPQIVLKFQIFVLFLDSDFRKYYMLFSPMPVGKAFDFRSSFS